MTATGWIGEEPEAAPAMPLTELMMGINERGPRDTLAVAMARSAAADVREERERAATARDPDEYAANLIAGGYRPGQISQLAVQLADTQAEAEAEREKIEKGKQRHEHVMRMHQNGQIGAWQIGQMLDGDYGDAHRAEQLERRAERLHREMTEAAQMTQTPEQRRMDAVEEASARARKILAEVADEYRAEDEREAAARAQMSRDRAAFRASRRPFGGGDAAAAEKERYRAACAEIGLPADGQGRASLGTDYFGRQITREQLSFR